MLDRTTTLLSCVLILGCAHLAQAEDWPQFRGPTGQGLSASTGVPVEWNTTKNVAWKTPIPGQGWSSPVVVAGKAYLTSAVPGNDGALSLHAFCLDAADGKVIWDVEVFRPDPSEARKKHPKNSRASPTPIVDGDRIYVHFGHLGTAALDLSGKVIWKQTSLKYPPVHGNGGSPLLFGGTLYFSCDGASNPMVVALDAKTGAIKWKVPRNVTVKKTFSFSTPLAIEVNGMTQIISPGSGLVGAYDPATGAELWRVTYGEGYSVVPRPIFAHGLLFLSSGFDVPSIYAINPDSARGNATATHVAWTQREDAPNTPSALCVGDELYFISDAGTATCVEATTGKLCWSHHFAGHFSASPVYAEGRIYYQSEGGDGFVIKAGKTFEQLAENDLGEHSLASYAVTNGALFIRTEKNLYKIAGK